MHRHRRHHRLAPALALPALLAVTSCTPPLSQPFSQLGGGTVTIYRLQNFEPPPTQPGSVTFQVPNEVQQLITGAAALLPPGLIPPGLLPGSTPPPAPTGQELRFHNFRVIDWKTVTDPAQKNEVLDILGHSSNFGPLQSTCMYAEFGFAFQPSPGASTDDVLVSLSCGQVQAFNFVWPYPASGISRDVANRIVGVASKAFGTATTSPPRN